MKFPTGGKVRERKLNRCNSGTDSTVWMEEDGSMLFLRPEYISGRIFLAMENESMQRSEKLRKMVLMAVFAATAYMIVALIRIPAVLFLSYEPKDVVITIGGFLLGPLASFIISLIVSLVEMVTISQTGPIGCLMNLLSTCSFACTAALIYKKQRSLKGAILGLAAGSVAMIAVMLLWNWLITPLYMGTPRQTVQAMLIPVFLPFNALKSGLNSALILGLYKPLSTALRKARLLPEANRPGGSAKPGIYLFAVFLLAACILLLLVFQGKI